ncbi:MAG: hypothetical protein Kapaf2KO_03670 [Candidatus Kapaibacteriales bacterium]
MLKLIATILLIFSLIEDTSSEAPKKENQGSTEFKEYFVGSTLFLLGNLDFENSPDFLQLNFGYRFTENDAVSLELKTWQYQWPLGVPYTSFQDPDEEFPGYIREYGFALAYQRFLWKKLYVAIHSMAAWQDFVDRKAKKVGDGFQIFNTYRVGYQVTFFDNFLFIEPSVAITHRPFHTKMPTAFREVDSRWPKYFIGEPGLHFGFNF